jgi:hypothetical protein
MADILATLSKLRHRDDDDHPEVKLLFFAEFAYCFMNLRCRRLYDDLILHDFSSSPLREICFNIFHFFDV